MNRGRRGASGEALQVEVPARVEDAKRLSCQDVLYRYEGSLHARSRPEVHDGYNGQ